MAVKKQEWGSRIGLILAMAGNSVGLGNFLRFPVQAVQNGGGAFIIPYLVCFLIMGIPLLWIEWTTGRFGGKHGYHATPFIFEKMGNSSKLWRYVGVLGLFSTTGVATYYCYIESWTISYVFKSAMQVFTGMSQAEVAAYFGEYVNFNTKFFGIPFESLIFYVLCIALNTYILSKGLSGGIERVAKVGMPLLILFGFFLAYKGLTLGTSGAYEGCTDCDSFLGLNFLWQPQFTSLLDPKVWLAAAGQIFFTLSVGMGCIHSYAAFVKENEDIALNSMSAGWMNEFVEVVLGSMVVIPIACGYLGLEWVKNNAGFAMAFQTMPFLFDKWGAVLGIIGGVFWFGLLFFAGITSSLAMCTPWIAFTQDEFKWSRNKAASTVGFLVFLVGLPAVLFFNKGWFDEYDYWTGTFSLFTFALLETILFAWVFGIDKGWEELNHGADIKLPTLYKPIIKYITPTLLIAIFVGSVFNPKNNDWHTAITQKWEFDPSSIIGKIQNKKYEVNRQWWANYYESEATGFAKIDVQNQATTLHIYSDSVFSLPPIKSYTFSKGIVTLPQTGDSIVKGQAIAKGFFINDIFYIDASRLLLLTFFALFIYMTWYAAKQRSNNG